MSDLISRQAVIELLATMQGSCTSKTALVQNSKIWQQIKDMPSAQHEPKKGKWMCWHEKIENDSCTEYIPHCKCSE